MPQSAKPADAPKFSVSPAGERFPLPRPDEHAAEYERIVTEVFDDAGEERPEAGDSFVADVVPGFCDGDYPPWLQAKLEGLLTKAVVARFGRVVQTSFNGSYLHVEPAQRSEIFALLVAEGYELVDQRWQ